jgi:hypothetical protein
VAVESIWLLDAVIELTAIAAAPPCEHAGQ